VSFGWIYQLVNMGDTPKTGAFNRKPVDKRLVKQVTQGQKTPNYWVPMDLANTECKIMEVRKFSADYFEVDAKFRRPGIELISAYAVQNPFLWGQYLLRREQLKMQLTRTGYTVKEKDFFYKSDFENFEKVCRQNFDPRYEQDPKAGVAFFHGCTGSQQFQTRIRKCPNHHHGKGSCWNLCEEG